MCFHIFKYTFFTFHLLFIFISTIAWPLNIYILYLQFIIIISWLVNDNKCLLSQLEYKLFNSTIIGNRSIRVPLKNRLLLYTSFIGATYYHLILP
jgi:hypothetical protein